MNRVTFAAKWDSHFNECPRELQISMFELKFPYLFYHNKLASLQIELCNMRVMQRCKKQERERICERTETMSGKSSRINSNGIIILSSRIEQERPVRHVAVQGG